MSSSYSLIWSAYVHIFGPLPLGTSQWALGWCVGVIKERNLNGRAYRKIEGVRHAINFHIY